MRGKVARFSRAKASDISRGNHYRIERSRLIGDFMSVKERILITICGICLGLGVANAQVIVHAGPPPPVIVERSGPPLHAGWVWVPGHYRWNGGRYIWMPGRWVNPPRRGAVWIPRRAVALDSA